MMALLHSSSSFSDIRTSFGLTDDDNVFAQRTLASGHATLRISNDCVFLGLLEHRMIPHLFLAKLTILDID